jgi:hypothetical protein
VGRDGHNPCKGGCHVFIALPFEICQLPVDSRGLLLLLCGIAPLRRCRQCRQLFLQLLVLLNRLFVLVIEQQLSLVYFLTVLDMDLIHRSLARIRRKAHLVLILKAAFAKDFLGIRYGINSHFSVS